jgi:hypothetical protein
MSQYTQQLANHRHFILAAMRFRIDMEVLALIHELDGRVLSSTTYR